MNIVTTDTDQIVNGLTVRTKNSNEINSSISRISSLWDKFFKEVAPSLNEGAKVYGVYSNYESDSSGEFDVTACTDKDLPGPTSLTILKGNYLVFTSKGEIPRTVIETWGDIWNYFSNEDIKYQRAYLTDYEVYKSDSEIEIFIGIK